MSIEDAARTGDRRKALEAMRDAMAAAMDIAEPAVIAQIAGRLAAVLKELDELGSSKKVTGLDELKQRRAARIAAPHTPAPAKRQPRKRSS